MKIVQKIKSPEVIYPGILFVILSIIGLFSGTYWLKAIAYINLIALIVLGLDFFSGSTFYLNLGILFPTGVSAYFMGFLVRNYGMSTNIALFLGIIIGVLSSLLIYLLTLKARGHYFAIGSLIFPLVFSYMITAQPLSYYFGGEGGIFLKPLFFEYLLKVPPAQRIQVQSMLYFYFSLAILVVAYLILLKISRSDLGKLMKSIGQNEDLAESIGVNTRIVKLKGFLISSLLASTAGVLIGSMFPPITTNIMSSSLLLIILTMIVVGGLGSLWAPLVTTYILMVVYEKLWSIMGTYRVIPYMLILILALIFTPYGLLTTLNYKITLRLGSVFEKFKKRKKRG